ncbi:eukaryotic translation initiation factor 2-alpha kinase 2 [Zopfia rhizophila CBS 207.26]|uniref:Eukaryotic translation initiation factor 2-alpha kinase 2 n=1 Tax=Zopfia rhizophila CBS 207.26 TaxID=1314779 RepID=A0A6A6EE94_9PEZI|nr:eukaryotic translation initiation factor 2-alpha kinase 2 [Zopfia rhizophila CBS 207.26]
MPSLFRRPGEDSSDDTTSQDGDDDTHESYEDLNLLSRINTVESGPTSRPAISRSSSQFKDLILHSLLEERARDQAAEHLGKARNDPEVQDLARITYHALSQQLSGVYGVDRTFASDEMQQHRAAAQEGIDTAARRLLPQLPRQEDSKPQALIPRVMSGNPPVPILPGLDTLFTNIASSIDLSLEGHPGLHTDRYLREFVEIDAIGKGGYGKVYRVKHKLDNSFYAVKRITVSQARLRKIKEHGSKEMECILEEVRALARFDHGNIVRYHNAWLEFTTGPTNVPVQATTLLRGDRLLEDASPQSHSDIDVGGLQVDLNDLSLGDPFNKADLGLGPDVVFESSDDPFGVDAISHGPDVESSGRPMKSSKRRPRRASQASQATIATISSTRSKMSAIESLGEVDDEDVETIPRSQFSVSQDSGSGYSQSMISHSDIPGRLVSARPTGPVLTLNVQMSLYETNLASFLSTKSALFPSQSNPAPLPIQLQHCFHPSISLHLLSKILSGVEYLHAQGVIHRDLKPANIFLSVSNSRIPPSGSVNLSSCHNCPSRAPLQALHVNPRIGDFGLVTALAKGCATGLASDGFVKPVGTEYYRPETVNQINEKLDVYALGIICFEMIRRFGTRMERVGALMDLRRGVFPNDFTSGLGVGGVEMQELIQGMVKDEEESRFTCDEIKDIIARILDLLETVV